MILDNPFRQLGLPATASSREVRRRLDELSVHAAIAARSDQPDTAALSRVRQQLEDPVQRTWHELFWVHKADALDQKSTVHPADILHDSGRLSGCDGQAIALHDLAVVAYLHFLENGGVGDDPSAVLRLWAAVVESRDFWQYVEERSVAMQDPRLTSDFVATLRKELPEVVLKPIARTAAGHIDDGNYRLAAIQIRAMRTSGFPTIAVHGAVRQALAQVLADLDVGADRVGKMVNSMIESDKESPAARAGVAAAKDALVDQVLAPAARLSTIDPLFSDAVTADRTAAAIRRVCMRVCNIQGDWNTGYLLIHQAFMTARTPAVVADLAKEQAQIATRHHNSCARQAANRNKALVATAHLEFAASYAETEDERSLAKKMALGARINGELTDAQVTHQKLVITRELEFQERAFRAHVEAVAERPRVAIPIEASRVSPSVRLSPSWRILITSAVAALLLILLLVWIGAHLVLGTSIGMAGEAIALAICTNTANVIPQHCEE